MRIRHHVRNWGVSGLVTIAAVQARAAISVAPSGSTTQTFATIPSPADWATGAAGGLIAGTNTDINSDATFDPKVQTVTVAVGVLDQTLVTNGAPGTNYQGQWNSASQSLQTAPTGNAATVILATLTNNAGGTATGLTINYDLAVANSAVPPVEQVAGHRIYYSKTGAANSWTAVGDFGGVAATATETVPVTIAGGWTNGSTLYVLWADDNSDSAAGVDAIYQMDNVKFTPTGVPEPATVGLGAVAIFGGLARRRRR
jgi:hypothetical protein